MSASRLRAKDLQSPFVAVRTRTDLDGSVAGLVQAYLPIMAPAESFSHGTAAILHGMWLPLSEERRMVLHVSVQPPARAPRDRRVKGHHLIPRPDLVQTISGIRVANPVETWCQLATALSVPDLVVAGDSLLARGRDDVPLRHSELLAAADDRARPAAARLRAAVLRLRPGCRSPWESILRIVLVDAGLPEPEINVRILDEQGRFVAECDLVFRVARVIIEYEGDYHRIDPGKFRSDIVRYERLQDLGWRVVRITVDDIRLRPTETVERVRRLLAR